MWTSNSALQPGCAGRPPLGKKSAWPIGVSKPNIPPSVCITSTNSASVLDSRPRGLRRSYSGNAGSRPASTSRNTWERGGKKWDNRVSCLGEIGDSCKELDSAGGGEATRGSAPSWRRRSPLRVFLPPPVPPESPLFTPHYLYLSLLYLWFIYC